LSAVLYTTFVACKAAACSSNSALSTLSFAMPLTTVCACSCSLCAS
jgi:hypothetical protein